MISKKILSLNFSFNIRVISIFLIIIQSCGIAFFEKKGTILMVIVLILSIKNIKNFTLGDVRILSIIFSFLTVSKILNPAFQFSALVFAIGLILEIYIFLLGYKKINNNQLIDDFYVTLKIFFINALIGYFLYLIIPFAFIDQITTSYPYKTFIYLFYVTNADGIRNTGLLWEPGLLQLILNLFLFFSIKRKKPAWFLLLIVLTLIPTFSTSGYFCLGLNYLYYVVSNFKDNKRAVFYLIIITAFSSGSLVFIWSNIADKLGGENLSGLARLRDIYIGEELIREKPLLGHGLYDEDYLKNRPYVPEIENNVFGEQIAYEIGSISGGYVNGLLDIFSWFGIPAGLLIYYYFYKNRFVDRNGPERIIFFSIMCFTFFAEPITYTSFFLLFPISAVIYPARLKKTETSLILI